MAIIFEDSITSKFFGFKITYLVDNPATVFFSIFMAIWTVLFIEFWKREQNRLQFEWDTTGLGKNSERIRPEFELRAEKRLHPLTGVRIF